MLFFWQIFKVDLFLQIFKVDLFWQIFKVALFWQNIKLVFKSKMQSTFFTSLPKKFFSFPRQIFFLSCFFFNNYLRCVVKVVSKNAFLCSVVHKRNERKVLSTTSITDHRSDLSKRLCRSQMIDHIQNVDHRS